MSRLRWQLTLSHLIAIAVTLVSMIAAVLFIASAWWTHSNDPNLQPVEEARIAAYSLAGLVRPAVGASTGSPELTQLNDVLRLIGSGDLSLVSGAPTAAPEGVRARVPLTSSLSNLAYLVVVGTDARVIASSDAAGADFAPPENVEWAPLVNAALGGTTNAADLITIRDMTYPAALAAYPVFGGEGRPIAAVVVATTGPPPPSSAWDVWQAALFFGAASLAVLGAASLFALASSSLVSYFLSRRLVRRLERLGRAAESFADGDLSKRVDVTSNDEVGELALRFNSMADRVAETLADLAREKRTVEAALQAKRELVANVSHELRTPLSSIRGHTESLLIRQAGEDELQRYLEVIHRESEHLSRLIDDLFLLSTTETGGLPLVSRPLDVREVVDDVVNSIHPAARAERHVQLLSHVEPDLRRVMADRQRVAQVLANLVRNAVRHTPEGGLVAVRAHPHDTRSAIIVVEDTGEGIPPDEVQHVFERFYRVDPSRDRSSGGSGLGLAIVRELVSAMGGEVSAESVVGEGSRFSFTLPFVSEASQLEPSGKTGANRNSSIRDTAFTN